METHNPENFDQKRNEIMKMLIAEELCHNEEYVILDLIYNILIQANSNPTMPKSDHVTA